LRGTVDTAEEKARAEKTAKDTDGVTKVVNQLKCRGSKATPKQSGKSKPITNGVRRHLACGSRASR
jgi:hypothetical protein